MPEKRDKSTGLPLPFPVDPQKTVCVTLKIPDAPEYRQAFRGFFADLGKWWAWWHTEGQSDEPARIAAELWRLAGTTIVYDDCGGGMSCDDIADCIETNASVKSAIERVSAGGATVFGEPYVPGTGLTTGQMNAQLNAPDECAYNVIWSQIEQYVDYLIDIGNDAFERIEQYTNAIEAGQNVPGGVFIQKLKNGSTAGKALEFLDWALETMQEAYAAADTTDNRNALKCALFCAMRDDCVVSIQGTLDVLNTRLGGVLAPEHLEDLPALAEAMTTITFNPALALDLWLLFVMGTAKTAGLFGVQGIDETVQLVLAVAVNDANNDWELLCECGDQVGFVAYGIPGVTTVTREGNVYTIQGGWLAPGGTAYIYVGASLNGAALNQDAMAYTYFKVNGVTFYDWGRVGASFTTVPPLQAPPPPVRYAGGARPGGNPASLSIVIETTLPFQGVLPGV